MGSMSDERLADIKAALESEPEWADWRETTRYLVGEVERLAADNHSLMVRKELAEEKWRMVSRTEHDRQRRLEQAEAERDRSRENHDRTLEICEEENEAHRNERRLLTDLAIRREKEYDALVESVREVISIRGRISAEHMRRILEEKLIACEYDRRQGVHRSREIRSEEAYRHMDDAPVIKWPMPTIGDETQAELLERGKTAPKIVNPKDNQRTSD